MPTYEWKIKDQPTREKLERLAAELKVSGKVAALLLQRGIYTYDEAKSFFRPSLEMLHDPFLMKDMEKAVSRLEKAIGANEKILFFGDYDVDGTTAVSLTYIFFSRLTDNIDYYIPDRYKEGYGVSFQGIDYAAENGFSLIVSLDCGIRSVDHVKYAAEKGIDFIICDHHLPGPVIPPAVAILDAKQEDCPYPFKELSGCGVGFKLCQAFTDKHNMSYDTLTSLLDLLAVSIACDIVQMTGENRVLAALGLQKINTDPRPGIKVLLDYNQKSTYTVNELVFTAGPRINAAGRLADAKAAVRLLIEEKEENAREMVVGLNDNNKVRQTLDQTITREALAMIEQEAGFETRSSTVVYNPEWHKGIIGIVASRLIEQHYRPTIVLTQYEGKITGSARSVAGFDIHGAIEKCAEHLIQFGGHTHAAGLSMLEDKVNAFREAFERIVSSSIGEHQKKPFIEVDTEIRFSEIDEKFIRILLQMGPFGPGNMNPVFVSHGIKDTGYARQMGSSGEHLKFNAFKDGRYYGAIAFGFGHYYQDLKEGRFFDICYHIEESSFNNRTSTELRVLDMKPA